MTDIMFQNIKSWFGYTNIDEELPSHVNSICDVIFCHSKHIIRWALYFRWEDQHVTYELEKLNGLIKVSSCQNGPPMNYVNSELASNIFLNSKVVHNIAKNSSLNGQKFVRGLESCQKFVEEMCEKLGIELSYDENNNPEFLSYFFKADVYFCHCPVPYINTEDIAKQHWALYFSWKHKRVLYELGKNSGYIKAESTNGDLPRDYIKVLVCSGKSLRPEEVHSAAMNCSLNNQLYSAGWRNCQIWVQEVAEKLDIDINYKNISGLAAFVGHLLPVRKSNAKPVRP